MLSNPHWNAPSFSSFETWLETKDPGETYPYADSQNCACAQYLKAVGKFKPNWLSDSKRGEIVNEFNFLAGPRLDEKVPDYTFGGLLGRVRKARQMQLAVA